MEHIYNKYQPLNNEQLKSLLQRIREGDFKAKEELAQNNFPLVKSIVRRFTQTNHDSEDLFQVGCIGLLKAIDRFDLNMEVCFSTYAVPLIMGEIQRYLRDDRPVSVSRGMREKAIVLERCRRTLRQAMGTEPELGLIAKKCGISQEDAIMAIASQRPLISFSDLMMQGEPGKERAEDHLSHLAIDESETLTERLNMAKMLEELPDRLAYIIRGRYFEEKTQSALAKELQVSQVQISRLEKKALGLIKEKMKA